MSDLSLLRAAHRLLKRNAFQGGAFHCIECGGMPEHPHRDGHDGHLKGCKWEKTQKQLQERIRGGSE